MATEEAKQIDDGEPAFPFENNGYVHFGMSLRDYFAAKAMQGLLIRGWVCDEPDSSPSHYCEVETGSIDPDIHALANDAYSIADAMLKAR